MTPERIAFVEENYETMPVYKMASEIKVAPRSLYRYCEEKGYKTLDSTRKLRALGKYKKEPSVKEGYFDLKAFARESNFI